MYTYIPLILYVLLYCISSYWDGMNRLKRDKILLCLAILCTFILGTRHPYSWIDTWAYVQSFENTKTLASFSFNDDIMGYSEKGYYLLCVIIRTFTGSAQIYLATIGLLSMTFLFKSLRQYSLLPVLSLCIYIARYFLGRDMNQMRAGLAIAIIMVFTYLLGTKNKKNDLKYFFICILVSYIHTSVLTAIPIIFLNRLRISKNVIFIGILVSFIVSALFSHQIMDFISQSEVIQEMAKDYVDKEGNNDKAYAADLTNPMIYYQCFILAIYTLLENKLTSLSRFYYVYRNGFFMSTVVLIVLCQYAILSGRVSTIFATFEIFMIPMIFKGLNKSYRLMAYFLLLIPMVVFFMYNSRIS